MAGKQVDWALHVEGIGLAFRMCESLGFAPAERARVLGLGFPIVTEDHLQELHRTLANIDERVQLVIDIKSALAAISGNDVEKERGWINSLAIEALDNKTPRSLMNSGRIIDLTLVASMLHRVTG